MLKQGGLFAPVSREGALVLNNLFLVTACATVFVGTLYPLALEALTGEKISVGAPFFNATFAPLFIPLMLAVPFGPLMAWKRGDLLGVAQRLLGAAAIALDRHRGHLRGGRRRADPGAVRDRARALPAGRRRDRPDRAHRPPQGAGPHRARARPRAAALGLGHRVRPCRARGHAARHHRRDPVGRRADRRGQARAGDLHPPLRFHVRRHDQPRRPQLSRARGPFHGPAFRRFRRRDGAFQAHLPVARQRHQRGRPDDARLRPALSLARRSLRPTARSRSGCTTSRWCC